MTTTRDLAAASSPTTSRWPTSSSPSFHKAIIQQSSGERPYVTLYDPFYGDVVQQGIIIDKITALQNWTSLFKVDNYDPTQSAGAYLAFAATPFGDSNVRNSVAEDALDSMIGGEYDVFPYFVPLAVAQFAQDTHSPSASSGAATSREDWIGGQTFSELEFFLHVLPQPRRAEQLLGPDAGQRLQPARRPACYDPRNGSDYAQRVLRPRSKKQWIWAYIPDRNEYVAVLREYATRPATIIVRNYNDYYVYQLDDGVLPRRRVSRPSLPMKYFFLDSFNQFN